MAMREMPLESPRRSHTMIPGPITTARVRRAGKRLGMPPEARRVLRRHLWVAVTLVARTARAVPGCSSSWIGHRCRPRSPLGLRRGRFDAGATTNGRTP